MGDRSDARGPRDRRRGPAPARARGAPDGGAVEGRRSVVAPTGAADAIGSVSRSSGRSRR